jgi:hypothetical protein
LYFNNKLKELDMEPTSGSAIGAVGLGALLVGAIGPVGADVMLVVISALAGGSVALAGDKTKKWGEVIKFLIIGLIVALVLSWALTGLVVSYIPALSGPYTPSVIAMCIGFLADRLPRIFNGIFNLVISKIQGAKK